MEVSELRINNIVNRKFLNPSSTGLQTCFTDCKIKAIGIEKVIYECKDKSLTKVNFDRIYPILLTEEWLLNFGFENNIEEMVFYGKKIVIYWRKFENHIEINGEKYFKKYVHQLQNLYYALTEEELIFK